MPSRKAAMSVDGVATKKSDMIVRVVAREAWLAARLLCQFLGKSACRVPNETSGDPLRPPELALELAAALRLAQLEQYQLVADPEFQLPSAINVLADCLASRSGREPKYSGSGLIARILWIRINHLSWYQMPGCSGDFRLKTSNDEILVKAIGRFLWTLRASKFEGDNV